MTWDAYHRRKGALREILEIADSRRDLTATDLLDRVDPQRQAFEDCAALLLELQITWFQRLSGLIDQRPDDLVGSDLVIACWVAAAAELPGARSLLDIHLDDPVLAKGLRNEYLLMAAPAGDSPAGRYEARGADLVSSARERAVYPVSDELFDEDRCGLVARSRSALAA